MNLPYCQHRGELVELTAPGSGAKRSVHECYQLHIRGRDMVGHVSPAACLDCGYHDDAFDSAPGVYQQNSPTFPTVEEFLARWEHCVTCPIRQANFCPRAMGSCSLTRKLEKCDFECPLKKFGRITKE